MTDVTLRGLKLIVDGPTQPHGSQYISNPAITDVSEDVWKKAAGVYTEVSVNGFRTDNGKLIYDRDGSVHIHGAASFTAETSGPFKTIEYGVGLNGTILQHSVMARRHQSIDIGTGAVHFDTMMKRGEYVEFFIRNTVDGTDIKVDYMYMFCMGMV